jgi:CSLREA domain-containing protein
MRRLLALTMLMSAVAAPAATATTIDVTTTFDATTADGKCSLREAISSANGDAAVFPDAGECPAGAGADTVVLAPGSYDRSAGGADDNNVAGDLDVVGTLTIAGAGAALTTIDAKGLDRVLDVRSGATLTIQGVTLTGGTAPAGANGGSHTGLDGSPGADANGDQGGAGEHGGGIRSIGTVAISDSIITGNHAGKGGNGGLGIGGNGDLGTSGAAGGDGRGGEGGDGGDGGGIWSGGTLTLTRVVVSDNHAGDAGTGGGGNGGMGGLGTGGVGGTGGYGTGGTGGFAGDGGGIFSTGGAVKVDGSTIRSNSAGAGGTGGKGTGGLGGVAGPNPSTGGTGGGATGGVAEQGGSGGGIRASAGTLLVTRDLVDGNSAGAGGTGGAATAGKGGNSTNGNGGHGGNAIARGGGDGGSTGGIIIHSGTVSDTTVTGNGSGGGGVGGAATGGNGGNSNAGGDALAGDGGNNGWPGGLAVNDTAVVHATITGNTLGPAGAGGTATAGTGTSSGNATPGNGGSEFSGGAISPTANASLRNSIVAANTAPACTTGLSDLGGNVSVADPSCPGANIDPLLGPLADNGGPTLTRRPASDSPVRDRVLPAAGCTSTDQRGAIRPSGAGCETGAYELAAPVVLMTQAAPTVAGSVNPNARATTAHFEYGTTAAYGSSTPDVAVPAGVEAVAVSADLPGLAAGTTYHVRLVATNADGTSASDDASFTTSSQGGGGGADVVAPVILSASVKPKTFKRRRGTTFRYKLSEAAKVVFTIQRKKGRRYVRTARFSKSSKAGANARKFKTRKLRPGRYRATLVATDAAGNRSKAKRLAFRVKR